MTWFYIDDGFYDHPKVTALDLPAIGLWTAAGSYCARHLTDGVITKTMLRRLSPTPARTTDRIAAQLVAAGLWVDDGDAWRFHDWCDWQKSKAKVEEERAARNERVNRHRKKRRGNALQARDGNALQARSVTQAVTQAVTPPPTQPDPPLKGGGLGARTPATHAPPVDNLRSEPDSPLVAAVPGCDHGEPRGPTACPLCRRRSVQVVDTSWQPVEVGAR